MSAGVSSSYQSYASPGGGSDNVFVRSRTLLFLSYRDSRSSPSYPPKQQQLQSSKWKGKGREGDEEEAIGLLGSQDSGMDNNGESSALLPSWVHWSEEVDTIINDIGPKLATLDKLHAKHLLPGFADRSAEVQRIRNLTVEITSLFRKAHFNIQKIQNSINQLSTTPSDAKLAENAKTGLASKLQELSSQFRKKQSVYLKRLKGYEVQSQEHNTPSDSLSAVDDDEQLVRSSLMSVEQQDESESRIDQRTSEITGIAQSIGELAELFRDLNTFVIDQGTLLDRIDYNVENMAQQVRGAAEELKAATTYQKRHGKRQLIFLLILLIFGIIILLVYKPRSQEVSPVPPPSTSPQIPSDPEQTAEFDSSIHLRWI